MDLSTLLTPEVITGIFSFVSAMAASLGTYLVGKRREKRREKESAKSDFDVLIQANEKFRSEIRSELSSARKQILALEEDIKQKNKEVEELRNSIADLKNELSMKERRISDMKVEILKRDLQIEELKKQINDLSRQTAAVALHQRQFSGSISVE